MRRDPNLDHDPLFWLLFASLLPFMIATELVYRAGELRARWRR